MLDSSLEPERILAVDDNTFTLRILQHTLEQAGYQVVTAVSGHEALNIINRHGMPHLAIVDWHMPEMSGIEFSHAVREFSDLPIIMLTAVANEDDITRTIEQFAEDYIVKPFSPNELVARVRRVLRRMGNFNYTQDSNTRVDDRLMINFPKREVLVGGEKVSLTPTESKLLYILVRNEGRIVTTEFILNRLWPLENALEDRLHVHIHRLRRKIEVDPNKPIYIIAERGIGYRFRGEV
ncbi:MAG: response regulator transcription factor [Anaerolineales bacterium]|nr:response regulator transcription factor [Anaerolineales bacterium]MCB8992112.1 response regulator transcription factor [Ardenticatenaceae bacterium]